MCELSKELELMVGRRSQDGKVSLSAHLPEVVTLRVTYGSERASTVTLTLSQVRELRRALATMEKLIVDRQARPQILAWDGADRRRPAA